MGIPEASLQQVRSLIERGHFDQGWQLLQHALQQFPENADLHNLAGAVLQASGQPAQALQHLQHAVRLQPDMADAWHNLALLFYQQTQLDDARQCYERAIALDPDNAQLFFNLSFVDEQSGDLESAITNVRRATELDPANIEARYRFMYLKRFACDWSGMQADTDALVEALEAHVSQAGQARLSPYGLNIHRVPDSCHDHVAQYFARQIQTGVEAIRKRAQAGSQPQHDYECEDPLNIGYISADFCSHAVGALVHQLFEHHDRDHFRIFAYALTQHSDGVNQVIRDTVDEYRELGDCDVLQAYDAIATDGIDILIDLGGYTKGTRPEILAMRPARVQISWLGYLNTMQAEFIDYVLADNSVIPPDQGKFFKEQVIRLPGCFLPASSLPVANALPRSDLGLPMDGVVFCSFNHSYKIEPDVFTAWMKILGDVPDSVLWLYAGGNSLAEKNLVCAAKNAGIDRERLVFAPRVPLSDHLARLSAADLFLDTFYYNAGATAVSAVQAGVPILTLPSGRILGRMGASINQTLGLEKLVCGNVDEYVDTAIAIALDADRLHAIRHELEQNRDELFDMDRFARKIEKVFVDVAGRNC